MPYMKKRTALIAAFVSLMPMGQTVLIGTGAVLASAGVMLTVPEKAKAESVNFLRQRGYRRQESGDYYGAIADFSKIIEINPRSAYAVDAYVYRGNAKYYLEDYEGAIADFSKVIEINPRDTRAYGNRGISKKKLGDLKGACADWREASYLGDGDAAKWVRNQC